MKQDKITRRTFITSAAQTALATTLLPLKAHSAPLHFNNAHPVSNGFSDDIWVSQTDSRWSGLSVAFNQEITSIPLAIALCQSVDDVISALTFCQTHSLPFSVRSGGHCYMGFSLINNGVVIDLSLMNDISYPQPGMVRIEPGGLLGNIYAQLFKQKASCIPGGTCESVGIAGLTLGGGIGLLNRKYGLTADVLDSIELIVPEKNQYGFKQVIASARENSDLFWACRGGGGGNFGLVTAFEFQLQKAPAGNTIFSEIRIPWLNDDKKDHDQLCLILNRWMAGVKEFNLKAQTDSRYHSFFSGMALFSRVNGFGILISMWSFHDTPGTANGLYQEFYDLLGVSDFPMASTDQQQRPYIEVMQRLGYDGPSRHFYNNSGFCNSIIDSKGVEVISEFLLSKKYAISGAENQIQIDSLGGKTAEYSSDFSAWPHRSAQFSLQFQSYWVSEGDKQACLKWSDDLYEQISPHLTGYCYRNYPNPINDGHVERYYGKHFQQLVEIKTKWDPENIFHISQGIPSMETADPVI